MYNFDFCKVKLKVKYIYTCPKVPGLHIIEGTFLER